MKLKEDLQIGFRSQSREEIAGGIGQTRDGIDEGK